MDIVEVLWDRVVTLAERICMVTTEVFQGTGISEAVNLNAGDGLEVAGYWVVTLGEGQDCMFIVDSYCGIQMYVYIQLDKTTVKPVICDHPFFKVKWLHLQGWL